jgi:hypothetical protein
MGRPPRRTTTSRLNGKLGRKIQMALDEAIHETLETIFESLLEHHYLLANGQIHEEV